jgi:ketosteroid isomerase-like protein
MLVRRPSIGGQAVKRRIVVALLGLSAACRAAPNRGSEDPAAGVRAVLEAQERAWNRGDLEGYMLGYWRSPDLVFFSGGERTQGYDATLERYRRRYVSEGNEMGRLTFGGLEIQSLGPCSALARGTWRLDFERRDPRRIGGLFTLVLWRLEDGWRIVHDHTSL